MSFMEVDMEKGAIRWVLDIVKTVVIAVLISMVLALVFALIVKAANVSENAISYVNQGIKIVSMLIAALIAFKRGGKGGWIKGLVSGLLYVITSFTVFSLIAGDFTFEDLTWVDFLTGAAVGVICGVIAVNVKKSEKNT